MKAQTFKYLIVAHKGLPKPVPFLFSKFISHDSVATMLQGVGKVLGAGFVQIFIADDTTKFLCYGESLSLGINSREDVDSLIIQKDYKFSV